MFFLKQKYSTVLPAAVLAMLLTIGTPAVVFASDSGTTTSTSGGSTATSSVSSDEKMHTTAAPESHTTTTSTETKHSETPATPKTEPVKKSEDHSKAVKSDAERQHLCTNKKDGLDHKFANIDRNSANYLTRINDIYSKTKSFQVASGLHPVDYAVLTNAADAAKARAEASVAALQSGTPTIDCASKDTASIVAKYKALVTQAHTDLKAYRQAVKAVLTRVREAQRTAHSTTTPTTNSDTKKGQN